MGLELTIRPAQAEDLAALLALYEHLTPNNLPFPLTQAEEIFARFLKYDGSAILLGEVGGSPVASCTVVIIPNLTRGGMPYALVENVVTHGDHRRCGNGKALLDAACARAWAQGCYKVMLMTGMSDAGTLGFYHSAGFEQSKTGFQKRRAVPKRGSVD